MFQTHAIKSLLASLIGTARLALSISIFTPRSGDQSLIFFPGDPTAVTLLNRCHLCYRVCGASDWLPRYSVTSGDRESHAGGFMLTMGISTVIIGLLPLRDDRYFRAGAAALARFGQDWGWAANAAQRY